MSVHSLVLDVNYDVLQRRTRAAVIPRAARLVGDADGSDDASAAGGLLLDVADADAVVRQRIKGGVNMRRAVGRDDDQPVDDDVEAGIDIGVALYVQRLAAVALSSFGPPPDQY